jgi:hypothetical protein
MSGEPPAKKSRTSPKSLLPVEYELPLPPELGERVIKEVLRNNDDVEGKKRHYLNPKLSPLWEFYNRAIQTTSNETKFDDFVTLLNSPLLNTWLENRIEMPVPVNPIGSDDDGFLTDHNLFALMTKTVLGGFDPALYTNQDDKRQTQKIMTNTKRLLLGLLQCKNVKVEFHTFFTYTLTFFKDTSDGGVVFDLEIETTDASIYLTITDHRQDKFLGALNFRWDSRDAVRGQSLPEGIILPIVNRVQNLRKENILPKIEQYVSQAGNDPITDKKKIKRIIEGLFADDKILDDVIVKQPFKNDARNQPTGPELNKLRERAKEPPKTDLFCVALAYFLFYVGLPYTIHPIQKQVAYFASFVDRGVVMQSPVYTT